MTTDFSNESKLPVQFTCDGKDISPELSWVGVPDKTVTLALILTDLNAPGGVFYHWVIYNIPATVLNFPQGIVHFPTGIMLGKNSWDKRQYNGPCPPKGDAHTYVFSLYALDTKLKPDTEANGESVINAMQGHILDKTELTATYMH